MNLLAQLKAQTATPPADPINGTSSMPRPAPVVAAAAPSAPSAAGGLNLLAQLQAAGAVVPQAPVAPAAPVSVVPVSVTTVVDAPPALVQAAATPEKTRRARAAAAQAAHVVTPADAANASADPRLTGARLVSAALAGNLGLTPTEVADRAVSITDAVLALLA